MTCRINSVSPRHAGRGRLTRIAVFAILGMLSACTLPVASNKSAIADGFIANLKFCGERRAITRRLAESYGESPLWIGLRQDGAAIEIFAGRDGSWTRVLITPNGIACVVGSGVGGQMMPPTTPGTAA